MYKMRWPTWHVGIFGGAGLIALMVFFIWPVKADVTLPPDRPLVCACCAEEGEWYETSGRLSSAQLHELSRVRFAETASTYQSPRGDSELSVSYKLAQTRSGRRWEFKFRDEQGKTGTLSFVLPATAVFYGADMQDSPPGGLGPALYKEWRLSGVATATGVLKKGTAGTARFRLVLQGRGNNCEEAEHFKSWILQVTGARFSYSFHGSFSKPD